MASATSPVPTIALSVAPPVSPDRRILNLSTISVSVTLTGVSRDTSYDLQITTDSSPPFRYTPQGTPSSFQTFLASPHLGLNTVTVSAIVADAAPSVSNTLSYFRLPSPINSITTADSVTSIDLAQLRTSGFVFGLDSTTTKIALADGIIGLGSGTSEALAQRLYLGLLGRAGDADGLGFYDSQLAKGATTAQVAAQILAGPEYAGRGTMTDNQFVTSLYTGFLNRTPQTAEAASALAQLAQGASRATLAASFATSTESIQVLASRTTSVFARDANGTLVNQLYRTGLSRQADPDGFATYKTFLATGASIPALANAIVGSAEFATLHAGESNAAFVGDLYRGGLGREADGAGLANYASLLDTGAASRATVTLAIATSAEAMAKLPGAL